MPRRCGLSCVAVDAARRSHVGDVIQRTGGLRKPRWSDRRRGKGKRGGLRIIYYYWTGGTQFWLFTVFGSREMVDLWKREREALAAPLAREIARSRDREEDVKMANEQRLFDELKEGFDSLAEEREGKRTLRTHVVEIKSRPDVTARELLVLREHMQLSRALFARYLRTNVRTLENWEQGRAKPNAQAALIIRMVEKYPDTVERLASI
jgi:putative transcriptional regulator